MQRILIAIGLGLVFAVGFAGAADAQQMCSKTNARGATKYKIRDVCKSRETDEGTVSLGGGPGGPNVVAYAHVNADGSVDLANSVNVTNANVSRQATSAFCFSGLPFAFSNAIAVIDYGDTGSTGNVAQVGLGDPFSDCSGVPGTQVEVATEDSAGFAPVVFFIAFIE